MPDQRDESEPEEEFDSDLSGALDNALEELRREIRDRFPAAAQPVRDVDWFALFDELRQRLNTFGMVERSGEVDEFGMDEVVLRRSRPLLDFMQDQYWRIDVSGLASLPTKGPCLLVSNRSGMLPYDGLMISHAVSRWQGHGARPRFLVADWLITLPFVQPYLAQLGGVRACRENAERILRRAGWVVAFPEGVKGAAKVYRDRYRLQRFGRGGVVRVAIEAGAPLVPVAVVGAEEVHPVLFKIETLARSIGLPFVPVTPTFPLLGPMGLLPLPSKWRIRFGEPIPVHTLGPDAAQDELLISRLTEELRERIQSMLNQALRARESVWS